MPQTERRKSAYYQRKAARLCGGCGMKPPVPGKAFCEECEVKRRKEQRDRYMRRKSAGLCTVCGKQPPVPGQTRCAECCVKAPNRYQRLKAAGLCAWCGKRPPVPGQAYCEECRAMNLKRCRIYRHTGGKCDGDCDNCKHPECIAEPRRGLDRMLASKKALRLKRIASGICPICGIRPAAPGRKNCEQCLEHRREYEAKKRTRKKGGL